MIGESELRRVAASRAVDLMVVDLDYSLGWFLAGLAQSPESMRRLRFKGGTCLRKCYYADYRFSEDLDFTATARLTPEALMASVSAATRWAADHEGPDFAAAPARFEVVTDEYGSESYQVRVYYRGPLQWTGSPRAIRLDVTRGERLLLPAATRSLLHTYSDSDSLTSTALPCYALEEMLAEKLRAVGGQRRFAVSRDLYDIYRLTQAGVSVDTVLPLLPDKFAARGIDFSTVGVDRLLERQAALEEDWQNRLSYLVADREAVSFAVAWERAVEVLGQVKRFIDQSQ